MFISGGHTYYRGSEQYATRGRFLILLTRKDDKCGPDHVFAVVRKVALRQLGHFMMGRANIGGHWVSVSGAYGSDGLPLTVDRLPDDAVILPLELYNAWNKGGGWNGAGNEAYAMKAWARATFV